MSLRRNAIANLFGQGWTTLMGLVFIPVYISYLGIEAYGLIGVFALLQTWLSLLDLGLTPTINREMARFTGHAHDAQSIRDLLRSIEIATIAIGVLVALAIAAGSSWLATNWLNADSLPPLVVTQALAIIGVVVGLRFIEGIYRSSIVGLQRQVPLNVMTGVLATFRGVGAVAVLAWVSPTVIAFFVWQGLVSIATVCIFAIYVHRALPPTGRRSQFRLQSLRAVWRFAAGSLLITFLGFLLSQSDKLILSSLLSLSAFGLYTLAFTVASAVRLLGQPIDQAVFPRLTQLYELDDQAGLASLYHEATQYNAVLVGGAGVFLAIFGKDVLEVWTQDAELATQVYPILWILVCGAVLNAITSGPYYLQMAAGWTGLLVRLNSVLVLVFVPLTYVLVVGYGAIGAAVGWVLLNGVYVGVLAGLTHRRLLRGELVTWYTKDLLVPLAAAAVTGVALRLAIPSGSEPIQRLLLLAIAFGAILLAASLAAARVRSELSGRLGLVLGRAP